MVTAVDSPAKLCGVNQSLRLWAKVELVPGVAGVFEITVDGRLAFSKKQTGRFPTDEEVEAVGGG